DRGGGAVAHVEQAVAAVGRGIVPGDDAAQVRRGRELLRGRQHVVDVRVDASGGEVIAARPRLVGRRVLRLVFHAVLDGRGRALHDGQLDGRDLTVRRQP